MPTLAEGAALLAAALVCLVVVRIAFVMQSLAESLNDGKQRLTKLEVGHDNLTRFSADRAKRMPPPIPTQFPPAPPVATMPVQVPPPPAAVAAAPAEPAQQPQQVEPQALLGMTVPFSPIEAVRTLEKRLSDLWERHTDTGKTVSQAAGNSETALQRAVDLQNEIRSLKYAIDAEISERMQAMARLQTSITTLGRALDQLSRVTLGNIRNAPPPINADVALPMTTAPSPETPAAA